MHVVLAFLLFEATFLGLLAKETSMKHYLNAQVIVAFTHSREVLIQTNQTYRLCYALTSTKSKPYIISLRFQAYRTGTPSWPPLRLEMWRHDLPCLRSQTRSAEGFHVSSTALSILEANQICWRSSWQFNSLIYSIYSRLALYLMMKFLCMWSQITIVSQIHAYVIKDHNSKSSDVSQLCPGITHCVFVLQIDCMLSAGRRRF